MEPLEPARSSGTNLQIVTVIIDRPWECEYVVV